MKLVDLTNVGNNTNLARLGALKRKGFSLKSAKKKGDVSMLTPTLEISFPDRHNHSEEIVQSEEMADVEMIVARSRDLQREARRLVLCARELRSNAEALRRSFLKSSPTKGGVICLSPAWTNINREAALRNAVAAHA